MPDWCLFTCLITCNNKIKIISGFLIPWEWSMCKGSDRQGSRRRPYDWSWCWKSACNTIFLSDHLLPESSEQNDSYRDGNTHPESVPHKITQLQTRSIASYEVTPLVSISDHTNQICTHRSFKKVHYLHQNLWIWTVQRSFCHVTAVAYTQRWTETSNMNLLVIRDVCSCSDPTGPAADGLLHRVHQELHAWRQTRAHTQSQICGLKNEPDVESSSHHSWTGCLTSHSWWCWSGRWSPRACRSPQSRTTGDGDYCWCLNSGPDHTQTCGVGCGGGSPKKWKWWPNNTTNKSWCGTFRFDHSLTQGRAPTS